MPAKKTTPPGDNVTITTADGGQQTGSVATTDETQGAKKEAGEVVLEFGDGENRGKVREPGGEWRDPTADEVSDRLAEQLEWGNPADPLIAGKCRLRSSSGEFSQWHQPTPEELATKPFDDSATLSGQPQVAKDSIIGSSLPGVTTAAALATADDLQPLPHGRPPSTELHSQADSLAFFVGLLKRQSDELLRLSGHLPSEELRKVGALLDDYATAGGDLEFSEWLGQLREDARVAGKTLSADTDWEEYFDLGLSPLDAIKEEESEAATSQQSAADPRLPAGDTGGLS